LGVIIAVGGNYLHKYDLPECSELHRISYVARHLPDETLIDYHWGCNYCSQIHYKFFKSPFVVL